MSFLDLFSEEEQALEGGDAPGAPSAMGAILAVDVGNVHTRAILLDVVDGQYRFVARGEAPTTDGPPWSDVFEGVRQVIDEISRATGRQIVDEKNQLIMPERSEFLGVSAFAATASAGEPIRTIIVGLVPDVSVASAKRAADSTYLQLVETFCLADNRPPEQQIDALISAEPDLMLIVGGTDGGAEDSLLKQVHTITLAAMQMDRQYRPVILYAGNRDLRAEIAEQLGESVGMRVISSENVRPALDMERLDDAQTKLATLYHQHKAEGTGGFAEIGSWTADGVIPTAHGFSRMVRILGELERQDVIGIDLGSASTAVAASLKGGHTLNVYPSLGMGQSARAALEQLRYDFLQRWLTFEPRHPDDIRNTILNKWLNPHSVPADTYELEIEYALAREIIRRAVGNARLTWRGVRRRGLLPPFGTILLSGSTLTRAPNDGWSALVALDALLPVGISRLLLDPYGLAPSLGAVAEQNPTAIVQVLDGSAFINAGTLISISGRARQGEIVVRGSIKPEGGKAEAFEAPYGEITVIPLERDTRYDLNVQPRRVQIDTGGRLGRLLIKGGELGLVIDARGRPWRFPRELQERRTMMLDWQNEITGKVRA